MKTAQAGDRVRVQYMKRFQDGSVASSRNSGPVELTIGVDHPRLPGLGLALVGLLPGKHKKLSISPEQAYGLSDPNRVRRLPRERFPMAADAVVGQWLRLTDRQGRSRQVRILEIDDTTLLVDTNRRGAGQTMELHVKLLGITESADAGIQA